MNGIVAGAKPNEILDLQAQRIVEFLAEIGLPHDNIIAEQGERQIIGNNLPEYIASLPAEVKRDARYLSKFVVGAGYGLFDYSLNAIWNEVVLDLRQKAIMYGLDIFYDAATGGSKTREFYKTEADLGALKDVTLLHTCRKLELISPTTAKKLEHILDMRNDIGISHPTNYTINAYELMGWLQTCVQDVLEDQPTEAAIQVQAFIHNLKARDTILDQATKQTFELRIKELPSHLCGNILRTVFGIFVSADTDPTVRKNIAILAPAIWATCIDEPKYKLGIVLEGYNANLHADKHTLGGQFFDIVDGNAFRSTNERSIHVNELLIQLRAAHGGWDNFQHEGPVAAQLAGYLPDHASILDNFASELFRIVLDCRMGKGVSYCNGVSPRGQTYYDMILANAGDKYAPYVLTFLTHNTFQSSLSNTTVRTQTRRALEVVKTNVISQRIVECLDYVIARIEQAPDCVLSTEFRTLSAAHINWA